MKTFTRGLAVAAATAALMLSAAGSASAALIPDPYSTTSASGTLREITPFGTGACTVRNVPATARGTPDGAVITLTGGGSGGGGTVSCTSSGGGSGTSRLTLLLPITITVARGVVTVPGYNVLSEKTTGRCLYTGTLTGTAINGGNSISAAGTVSLIQTLMPFCGVTLRKEFSLTLPGAVITW